MEIYEQKFLISLGLTISIETAILILLVKTIFKKHRGLPKISPADESYSLLAFTGFLASFSTLPYLWFILPFFIKDATAYTVTGEISVFLIESIMYGYILKTKIRDSLILSFTCNLCSFLIGLVFWKIF